MTRALILRGPETLRAREAGGPLMQVDPAKLEQFDIAAVEVDGRIIAYWVVWRTVHVEPLWVQEEFRRNPAVIGGIVGAMQEAVEATGEPAVFAVIEDGPTAEIVARYADRLGFHEAPGKLYYLVAEPATPPERG